MRDFYTIEKKRKKLFAVTYLLFCPNNDAGNDVRYKVNEQCESSVGKYSRNYRVIPRKIKMLLESKITHTKNIHKSILCTYRRQQTGSNVPVTQRKRNLIFSLNKVRKCNGVEYNIVCKKRDRVNMMSLNDFHTKTVNIS